MNLTLKTLFDMLYYMKLTREIEVRLEQKLYRQGKIAGGVYVGRGQEAIAVGSCIQLEQQDCICPSHRDMGAFLVRGFSPREIFAHYMGRKTGPTHGKDANLHIGDMCRNVVAFVSMLADTIPVAVGIGRAYQMRRQRNVVLCYFGDGATSRGDWHEGLNLASVWKVPVVYICNNNQYAFSTPLEKQMAVQDIAERAKAYGMPGYLIDGNNVIEVFRAANQAIKHARDGGGPSLIECKTFRMTGHSGHDDLRYVPKELFAEWERKDPIERLQSSLLEREGVSQQQVEELDARILRDVDEAVRAAENDPFPEPSEALQGVYAPQQIETLAPSLSASVQQ